ncbi:MAG: hypothetical protein ACLF0G_02065 [Candidatus Brocadiia bacterium]
MNAFPRTTVGGVSLPRMLIGSNWFLGYSHTSRAKDRFLHEHMDRGRIAGVIEAFLEAGVDAVMGPLSELLCEAAAEAQDRSGRQVVRILTPSFNIRPGGPPEEEPEPVFDRCRELGATFCFPHTSITDQLVDRFARRIRQWDRLARLIRERGMVPGLSTHLPESVVIADESGADVESYIQIYNAAGFLMHVEADWQMRIIRGAAKPVMAIKPFAAGRLHPLVGLTFVWNTLRDQDMVTVGTMTPDEARELIEISHSLLERRMPRHELQRTRSKAGLESAAP